MTSEVPIVLDQLWIVGVIAVALNGLVWWLVTVPYRRRNPELTVGYRRLILGFVVCGSFPWLLMGLAVLSGAVPSVQSFVHPGFGEPGVLAWYAGLGLLWALGLYWLIWRQGAEEIVRYPGLLPPIVGAKGLRILWIVLGVAALLGFLLVATLAPSVMSATFASVLGVVSRQI